MAQTAALQVVGLPQLLRKLDQQISTKFEEKLVLAVLSDEGADSLRSLLQPTFPKTSASVGTRLTPISATINADRYPYVFFERGSQYPVASQLQPGAPLSRSRRRRRGVLNSALRIQPRRYLARTRRQLVRKLPTAIEKARQAREKAWAA